MIKRIIITLAIALAVIGGIFGYGTYKTRQAMAAQAAMAMPPPTVTSAVAQPEEWRSSLNAVGTLESHAGITVRAEAEGLVARVAFASGAKVVAGDLLVELDLDVEQAQLAGLEATAKLAAASLARARDLREQGTNSQADLDAAEAEHARALAAVEQMRATIAKKRVVAPFAGRLGITQVDDGQFLNKGDPIVQLEALDPIYADFSVPQQEIEKVAPGMPVRITVDAFGDREFPGTIEAVSPRINDATRNVRVRAVLANTDEVLRPGMFARVAVEQAGSRPVLVLPTSSIVYNSYGNAVYVLTEQKTDQGGVLIARQQFVELGPTRGSQIAIIAGLQAGDQVVTSGQIKLRSGMPVQINNAVTPSANPTPQPGES